MHARAYGSQGARVRGRQAELKMDPKRVVEGVAAEVTAASQQRQHARRARHTHWFSATKALKRR